MARPLRIEFPGAYYHVTCRGNERRRIFLDRVDYVMFLDKLALSLDIYHVLLHAYICMRNHFHMLLSTPEGNLSEFMRHFNISYTAAFNRRHRRVGHLYQGRYKAYLIEADSYLLAVSRYIHLNPVSAGLVERPEDWVWSSFRGYDRVKARVQWVDYGRVLGEFGGDNATGRRRYVDFVSAGLREKLSSPLSSAVHGLVLGSEGFRDRIAEMISSRSEDSELPQLNLLRQHPTVKQVVEAVATYYGVDLSRWRGGRRDNGLSRAVAVYVARQITRESLSAICQVLGYRHVSSIGAAYRRVEKAIEDKRTAKEVNELLRKFA